MYKYICRFAGTGKAWVLMMKKKFAILAGIMLSTSIICGCGSTVPDLTEEETAMITEYATNLVVKHSEISNRQLLGAKELEIGILEEAADRERQIRQKEIEKAYLNSLEVDAKEREEESKSSKDNGEGNKDNAVSQKSMAEFFDENSFLIDYTSYSLCSSYPENEADNLFMAMDATAGKQLCVLHFQVKNQTEQSQELNMLNKKERFTLRLDDGQTISAQSTLLMDDLSSYVGTVEAGNTKELVLIFEVEEGVSQMDNMELIMKDSFGENKVPLN